MAIDAITKSNDGREFVPNSDPDWQDWVSASKTRNFVEQDPLLDWLNEHGGGKGFQRDDELPGYDERTDFLQFIFAKGHEFESAVLGHLQSSIPITVIAEGPGDIRAITKARDTFEAMETGEKIIAQGVLWNPENQTYGAPDLLVRSDVIRDLFPDALTADEAAVRAPDLGHEPWHYRVVDVKFTTLDLDRSGHEKKGHVAYMAQTFIYNEALGRLQGFLPPSSYLLGRGWRTSSDRGRSCMERLSRVDQDGAHQDDDDPANYLHTPAPQTQRHGQGRARGCAQKRHQKDQQPHGDGEDQKRQQPREKPSNTGGKDRDRGQEWARSTHAY
ncbi:MAG: hypothetical protein IIB19_07540 [Chloroflexi bacterium]|nr:hypothetical protein [Chloroflexota bacterium]